MHGVGTAQYQRYESVSNEITSVAKASGFLAKFQRPCKLPLENLQPYKTRPMTPARFPFCPLNCQNLSEDRSENLQPYKTRPMTPARCQATVGKPSTLQDSTYDPCKVSVSSSQLPKSFRGQVGKRTYSTFFLPILL